MEEGAKQYSCEECGNQTFHIFENPPGWANIISWDVDCTKCGKTRISRSNYD